MPGLQPRDEGGGGGSGEPNAWVHVMAAERGDTWGREHGGIIWADDVPEGALCRHLRA